jgi:site-specific DNA-cytosine methylase
MKLRAIDLFAGAGGTSTGLALAAGELGAARYLSAWQRTLGSTGGT